MAVWFTTERAKVGPVFGFVDKFEGLGIFFDTYANSRHSGVSILVKNTIHSLIWYFYLMSDNILDHSN